MTALLFAILLAQVEPFKVDSKKITPEISEAIDKLDRIRDEAFKKAREQTSARLPGEYHVLLEAADGADPDPVKFKPHSGRAAETWSESDTVVKIRFYIEYFANGLGTPESTLQHEMVHAVMRLDLGKEKYQKLPKWFREGTAVFIAGQMVEKLNHGLMRPEVARDPEKLLDGLDDADHDLGDYWEDAMGIVFLSSRPMRSPMWQVIDRVRKDEAFQDAVAAVTGGPYEEFVAGARDHATKALKAGTDRMKTLLTTYANIALLNEKSGELCEEFLKKWPSSPLTSAVLYYKAKSAKDDAVARYDDFIKSAYGPDGKVDFIDDAKLRKARLLACEKKAKEAAAVYADLVTWHVGSSVAIDALYEWGLLEKSSPLLKRALEIAPKHLLANKARNAIGE